MRRPYWELNQRGGAVGPRSPVVCGRKHCAGCGRWRHVCDFREHRGCPRPRCRVCQAAYSRAWRQRLTPEQRARINEYHRFWSEAQRRRQGIQPRNFRHRRTVIDRVESVGLPPGPLRAVITWTGLPDIDIGAAAGVPPRSVYRVRMGESRHVRLDIADKLALALGIPLEQLYAGVPTEAIAIPPQLRARAS